MCKKGSFPFENVRHNVLYYICNINMRGTNT